MKDKLILMLCDIIYSHFTAISGYTFWLFLIWIMIQPDKRFDNLVVNMASAWVSSVATYMATGAVPKPESDKPKPIEVQP